MGPKVPLFPISNTTAETSLLDVQFSTSDWIHGSVWRVTATGRVQNNSGSPATFTFRLRNTTHPALLASTVVTAQRPFRLEIIGEGNTLLADGQCVVSDLRVGAGATDTAQAVMDSQIVVFGVFPQNWDLSVQMSIANSNTFTSPFSAHLAYAHPESP